MITRPVGTLDQQAALSDGLCRQYVLGMVAENPGQTEIDRMLLDGWRAERRRADDLAERLKQAEATLAAVREASTRERLHLRHDQDMLHGFNPVAPAADGMCMNCRRLPATRGVVCDVCAMG